MVVGFELNKFAKHRFSKIFLPNHPKNQSQISVALDCANDIQAFSSTRKFIKLICVS
jgi:hypothetical protein